MGPFSVALWFWKLGTAAVEVGCGRWSFCSLTLGLLGYRVKNLLRFQKIRPQETFSDDTPKRKLCMFCCRHPSQKREHMGMHGRM